jgi:hypothetical protein
VVGGAWNIGVGIAAGFSFLPSTFFSLFSALAFFTARLRVFFGSSAILKTSNCTPWGDFH